MPDDRNSSCGGSCGCSNNSSCGCGNSCNPLSGLFGGNRDGGCGGDSTILFFIIIFLLLFTNCGCCSRG